MAETFIVDPNMTDEEIQQGINSSTRFVIAEDHTNTEPTGGPLAEEYIRGRVHIIDQLIRDYPNCMFILDHYRFSVEDCDNVIWLPLCWMMFPAMMDSQTQVTTDWQTPRPVTVNHAGGKNRINRILLEHWLAKNYPLNQLTHTKKEESELSMIESVIRSSSYANKKHLRPRQNLPVKWFDHVKLNRDDYYHKRFHTGIQVLIKELKLSSYLALQTEAQDITLNTTIGEKTWESMVGGNLVLQFGNYRINRIYKKLGLETFEHCFDDSHTESTDRYYQTIGGCENNKALITNHDNIEALWFENLPALKHNSRLAKDIHHWFQMFEQPMRLLCDALALEKNIDPFFVTSIPVDRFRYEFKL